MRQLAFFSKYINDDVESNSYLSKIKEEYGEGWLIRCNKNKLQAKLQKKIIHCVGL